MDLIKQILNYRYYFRFRLLCQTYMLYIALLVVVLSLICVLCSLAALLTSAPGKSAVTRYYPVIQPNVQVYLNQEIEKQYKTLIQQRRKERINFVQNRLRLQHGVEREGEYFENMKPAAKLISTGQAKSEQCDKGDTMDQVKTWLQGEEHYDATGFMRFGMKLYNGRIVVPLTGTYAIYSHVEYNYTKNTWCTTDLSGDTFFRHEIYRYNVLEGKEQVLVSAGKRDVLIPNGSGEIVGSYVFTIDDLRAGDELAVRVNNINRTTHSFFGLNHI